jgi:hypothetical protein
MFFIHEEQGWSSSLPVESPPCRPYSGGGAAVPHRAGTKKIQKKPLKSNSNLFLNPFEHKSKPQNTISNKNQKNSTNQKSLDLFC